jgi:hypothetical protein
MHTLPAPAARRKITSPRKPPRPPQSWSYDRRTAEVTIVDCRGFPFVYRILPVPADTGKSWELINVDHRFGECRTVHLGGGDDCCDCPGFSWSGHLAPCKHLVVVADLVASGQLTMNGGAL